jgi:O-antigen/teichoic acid export membrane protein
MVLPLFMPESLYYFLPRSDRPAKRLYINQTLIFLVLVGTIAAWALSEWNPFLPGSLAMLEAGHPPLIPLFVLLWLVASLLDVLPTVDERVGWQAKAIVSLSMLRALALGTVALVTHDFVAVVWTLVGFTLVKLALLLHYIAVHHGLGAPFIRRETFSAQFRHAAPFGFSGTLYGLRAQADQWVAAARLPGDPLRDLLDRDRARADGEPLPQVGEPRVPAEHEPTAFGRGREGDARAQQPRQRAGRADGVPLLALAFVFAEPLITLVYTGTYAAPRPCCGSTSSGCCRS